jgi:HEAT repeat protein
MTSQQPDFFGDALDGGQLAALIEAGSLTANVVLESLWHGRASVRLNAARALPWLAPFPPEGEPMLAIAARDEASLVRDAIVTSVAAGVGRGPVALPILIDALAASDEGVRRVAFDGVARRLIGARAETLAHVVGGLGDVRALVVSSCARLLTETLAEGPEGARDAVGLLVEALASGVPGRERAAYDVLDILKWSASDALVEALARPAARRLVVKLLGSLGRADEALRLRLNHAWAEADAAADAGWRLAVDEVLADLSRGASATRTQPLQVPIADFATTRLSRAELEAAVEALGTQLEVASALHALRDGRGLVRENAVRLLEVLVEVPGPAPEVATRLGPLVRDPEAPVRIAAVEALAALGPDAGAPGILAGLGDRVGEVRRAALGALVSGGTTALGAVLAELSLEARDDVLDGVLEAVSALGGSAVPALSDALASGAGLSASARQLAARGLGVAGAVAGDEGLAVLLTALGDPLEGVRREAARAIGLIGVEDAAILGGLRALYHDAVPGVRREAALAVARITGHPLDDRSARDPEPVGIPGFEARLLEAAELRAEVVARTAEGDAAEGESETGPIPQTQLRSEVAAADPARLGLALRDGRVHVRRNAARVLGELGRTASSQSVALGLALRDAEVEVRRDAAEALHRLGEAALPALAFLVGGLGDPDAAVRETLAEAIAALHPASEAFIIEGLRVDREAADRGVMQVIARLEGRIVDAIAHLGLTHASGLVRINAARALELLASRGAVAAVDALKTALSDNLGEVRAAAESALDAILGLRPRPVTVREPVPMPVDGFDAHMLTAAQLRFPLASQLTAGSGPASAEALTHLLTDGRPVVRANAVRLASLSNAGPAVTSSLLRLGRDAEPEVRLAVAEALETLGAGPGVAELLVARLGDRDPRVRAAAARALDALGAAALPALVDACADLPKQHVSLHLFPRLAASTESPARLSDALAGDEVPRKTRVGLLRALRAFERAALATHAPTLEPIVARLARTDDREERQAAIAALDRLTGRDVAEAARDSVPWPVDGFEDHWLLAEQLEAALGDLRLDRLLQATSDGREVVRGNAALALGLGRVAHVRAALALRPLLRDGSAAVRVRAVNALALLEPSREVAFDLVHVLADGASAVATAARSALHAYGPFATEALVYALDDEPGVAGRVVMPALVEFGPPALDALALGATHASALVRANAWRALRFFAREDGRAALAAFGSPERDPDRSVRLEARKTRDWLDGREPTPAAREPLPLPHPAFAIKLLDPDDLRVGLAHDSNDISARLGELLTDGRRHVRANAASALGLLGRFHAQLGLTLRDEERTVRRAVAEALASMGPDALPAAPQLVAALADSEAAVADAARQALSRLGADALPALVAASRMPPDRFRALLWPVVAPLGEAAVAPLTAALGDASAFAVMNALFALGQLGAKSAVPNVTPWLRHPLPAMVAAARSCLARLEGPPPRDRRGEAIPMPIAGFDSAPLSVDALRASLPRLDRRWLAEALFDGRAPVRENAARAWGCLGPEASPVVERLVIALKDAEVTVQIATAEALGALGLADATCIPALVGALFQPREPLRRAIFAALDQYGPTRVANAVRDLLVGLEERALGTMGRAAHRMPESFVPMLSEVAADASASLIARENAVVILGDLLARGRSAEETLFGLVTSQESMLALKAANALARLGTPGPTLAERLEAASRTERRPLVGQALVAAARSLRRRKA